MTRAIAGALCLLLVAGACESNPQPTAGNQYVAAANGFTLDLSRSRLSKWKLRAHAAGDDCRVLFVETPMLLEDTLIEALHYGAGAYRVHEGGVQRFCRDRAFRGTAYRDRSGRTWTFGDVAAAEAPSLRKCQ